MEVTQLLKRVARGRGGMALVDQAMVSAANFLTGIVLVRGLGLTGFGKYAITVSLILYVSSLQGSLVSAPMLSIAPLIDGQERRDFVNGMLMLQLFASAALFAVFAVAGIIFHLFSSFYTLPCILAFACYVGTYQIQDWLKRYYFLYHRGVLALVTDFISYVVQLGILFGLWRLHRLTLFWTLVVMCATSVAAFLMGPFTDPLRPAMKQLRTTWDRCRVLSRDLSISTQVRWLGSQGYLIIGTWIVGARELGGLRATYTLAGPVYLILNSLENVVPIYVANQLRSRGSAGAYKFIRGAMLAGLAGFGLMLLPIGIFGKQVLNLVYGKALIPFYIPMLLQLVLILSQVPSRMWSFLYRGLQDSRALLGANIIAAVTTLACVYPFGRLWGASGLVLSSLASQAAVIAFSVFHWYRNRHTLLLKYQAAGGLDTSAMELAVNPGIMPGSQMLISAEGEEVGL